MRPNQSPKTAPRKAGTLIEARGRSWRLVVDQDHDPGARLWCAATDAPDDDAFIVPNEITKG